MLTKIVVADIEGTTLAEVDAALVEDNSDPDARWARAIVWNGRVFVSLDIPDCDAPENYARGFEEVPVVTVVNGDKSALAGQVNRLAKETL